MTEPTSTDEARGFFAAAGLSYEQITENDIRALDGYLAIEYAQHVRDGGGVNMHTCYRKKYQPEVRLSKERPGIEAAFIRVSSDYFSGREAISFNEDGFIGFAGWASGTTIKPFIKAFYRWITEWMIGDEADDRDEEV